MSLFWWPRRSSAYTHFVSKLSAFASISHIFRKRIILLNSPESARRRPALYGAVFLKKRSWRLSTTRTLRLIVWERCFYPRDACSEVSVARSTSTAAWQLRWTNVARSTFECAINRHKKVTSELESPPNLFYRETNASADTFNDVLHFFFFACPLSLYLRFFFRHLFLNLFTIHCCRRLKSTIYTNFVFFIFMHSFFSPSVSIAAYICFFFACCCCSYHIQMQGKIQKRFLSMNFIL